MSALFTQHRFPRWIFHHRAHHDVPVAGATNAEEPKARDSPSPSHNDHHRLPGHDAFSRFLQALNLHYGPEDHDVIHPHFDLVETKTCYAVYGELPGLGQEDVAVEANDHLFTVTISGELRRPTPKVTEVAAAGANLEGVGITHQTSEPPTVITKETQPQPAQATEATTSEVNNPPSQERAEQQEERAKPEEKKEEDIHWHVTERRVGHFKRVFRFPVDLVEMTSVKASMHHGLLCVIVPKREDVETYNKKLEDARRVDVLTGSIPLFGYFF